ncbi:lantibiotic ABC transporter permease [Paenibacillus albidus]|uniref:Lantibiotic ABC transporter permease n=1 Tax=Paenibacillus albidus TaxID=2041023 RepID=A0A917FAI1_9BACL|nr:ABC transporter permease [Paenibacillus albidus]GGF62467.1 lantibiotic ABC transporter permease [Paenibacillus albidus]
MEKIIKTELLKLKRYSILWVGVMAMVLTVLLSWFENTATEGAANTFVNFSNSVMWNSLSLIYPATITLIAGYIINREHTDDTLKNIRTIPVTYQKLLVGKLAVVGLLAVFLGFVSFLLTMLVHLISQFSGLTAGVMFNTLLQMIGIHLCLYIAVLPIIVFTSRKPNGFMPGVGFAFFYGFVGIFASGHGFTNLYPIAAGLGVINYQEDGSTVYNRFLCFLILLLMLIIALVMIRTLREPSKGRKVEKRRRLS